MDVTKHKSSGYKKYDSVLIEKQIVRYRIKPPVSEKDCKKASMSDQFINKRAMKEAIDKHNNSPARKVESGLFMVGLPVAASIASGALSGAEKVAEKTKITLMSGKNIAVAIAGFFGVYKAIDFLTKKVPVLRKFRKKHPDATVVGTLAGSIGALYGANKAVDTAAAKTANMSTVVKSFGEKIKTQVETLKNESGLGKTLNEKIFKPAEKFLTETSVGKFIKKNPVAVLLGVVALNFVASSLKVNYDSKNIKQKLEHERNESVREIVTNPFKQKTIKSIENSKILMMPARGK